MFKLSSFEKEVLTTLKTHGYEFIERDYDGSLIAYNVSDLGYKKLQIKSFVSDVHFEFIKRGDSYVSIDILLFESEISKNRVFEIGDKVCVRDDLNPTEVYGGLIFPPHIARLVNGETKPFTIVDVDKSRNRYKLEGIDFYFTTDMLK